MNQSFILVLPILILTVTIEARASNEKSTTDWSMERMDSQAILDQPMQSMSLELDNIELEDSDDVNAAFLPKNNDKREIRDIFELVLNILDSIRSTAKNDIRRTKKRELSERLIV